MKKRLKSLLHRVFGIAIFVKGMDGILSVIGSVILLFSASDSLKNSIPRILSEELVEDPHDLIANYLLNASQNILPDTQTFIALYLGIHGLIKIGLALALKSHNQQAYSMAKIVLFLFVCYQFYRFSHTHSGTLFLFALMDIIIIILIHFEAKNYLKKTVKLS